ncbi:MAG: cyclic nucleotide-binding domain-containing protein [Bdellovibrio sp.]|nr:cyclic nucleotide-binding domain-containing protein [Bdellovibrio sp.]
MDIAIYTDYVPYAFVLTSLFFGQRYHRHFFALVGAVVACLRLPIDQHLAGAKFLNSPAECFWLGMVVINLVFLMHAAWLHYLPLSEPHRMLYNNFFKKFSRANFKQLIELGTIENKAHGALLIKQGEVMEFVMCILDGSAGVIIDGDKVASLKNGDFIGEMSFLSGNLSSATVRAEVLSTLIIWRQTDLKELLRKNPSLLVEFNRTIERQLAGKLIHKNRQIS